MGTDCSVGRETVALELPAAIASEIRKQAGLSHQPVPDFLRSLLRPRSARYSPEELQRQAALVRQAEKDDDWEDYVEV